MPHRVLSVAVLVVVAFYGSACGAVDNATTASTTVDTADTGDTETAAPTDTGPTDTGPTDTEADATDQASAGSSNPTVEETETTPLTEAPASGEDTATTEPEIPDRPQPPEIVRALRVSRYVASSPTELDALFDQAAATTVNALVFDTKDETGQVLYATGVEQAAQLGAVTEVYDPAPLLERARAEGLYPITRVVTFEDTIWAEDPESKLAGKWVNAADTDNWEYPLALATEACEIGFAEIQFDYVRFPAGKTAVAAAADVPPTGDGRSQAIAGFLTEAGNRLKPMGCRVSAAVFGITMSSPGDEGIGQQLETVAPHLDAISPMIYPSHYNSGWLGLADPNEHPGEVVADALGDALDRLTAADISVEMRPWVQAFRYNSTQVQAQLIEAEQRGAGWILWNSSGTYNIDWLPTEPLTGATP